jgi:hypothetical protein
MMNKIVQDIIDISIKETKKDKNIEKIKQDILSPLIDYIAEKLKPYIFATCIFATILVILITVILFLILVK